MYPIRSGIPDFLREDLGQSTNRVFRLVRRMDWLARVYETRLWYPVVINLVGGLGSTSLPELIAIMKQIMQPVAGAVLDVACGPGTYGRRVANAARTVYGIDISWGMLQRGKAYAHKEHVPEIHFSRAQVEALPFRNGFFDGALCCGSLHLFPDPVLGLREVARTLKPGAPLGLMTIISGKRGLARFAAMQKRFQSRGGHVFQTRELEEVLSKSGFERYCPEEHGSILTASARKRA